MEKVNCVLHQIQILKAICLNEECNKNGSNDNLCRFCIIDKHKNHVILY